MSRRDFLVERLLDLPPRIRIAIGVVFVLGGAVTLVVLWGTGWFVGAGIFALSLGVALVLSGRSELRRGRERDAEFARAGREWRALERGVDEARRQGHSAERFLQAAGYRDTDVRRWIAAEAERTWQELEASPFAADQLRQLFARLTEESATGYECDHQFTLTRRFLEEQRLPAEPALRWLGSQGAGCDCEVSFNVEDKWSDRLAGA